MSDRPRILIHVQHLLGTGHLRRMGAIARALSERGARVVLASGGTPVPGLAIGGAEFVQLAPARAADATFKQLVALDGTPVDDDWRRARARTLLDLAARLRPDLILIEHFPFGRRLLEFELLPLIAQARAATPRPVLVSSVRDVLVAKPDPAKRAAMVARAIEMFDRVLFHGDPRLLPLSRTLPEADALGDRLAATGYVAIPPHAAPATDESGRDEIVVSAGGGAVGRRLLDLAIQARALSGQRHLRWRVLTAATGIPSRTEPGLVVEPNRPDFQALLARALLSVSQAGYNTVVDLLAARTRAILVPFAEHGETEQSLRADALAARGLATVLTEAELNPDMLARAIDVVAGSSRPTPDIDLDGASRSAEFLLAWSRR